jgi:hypothetical protein
MKIDEQAFKTTQTNIPTIVPQRKLVVFAPIHAW